MKNNSLKIILGALVLSSAAAQADCVRAVTPTLPDGETAVLEAMVAGQTAMKEFLAVGNEYLACLDQLREAGGTEASAEAKDAWLVDYNSVVAEQEAVASEFNTAIKAYKARQ
jgi:hypothetical protein